MIKSATQYPVHSLLSHENNTLYRVPPYQREYSWQKAQWEELFDDLIEAEGAHFLGTIITLNQTEDAIDANVLELIDGQQRMTTLTLLMAAVYSVLKDHDGDVDGDQRVDMSILRRQLVRTNDGVPRVRPQLQGSNLNDYQAVLAKAGLPLDATPPNYMGLRRISRCFEHFRKEIQDLAQDRAITPVDAAFKVLAAAKQAIIVKIEVANHADAFVLFESLNNRGMPLTPVDLIKNHLLAEAERRHVMDVERAFKRWNDMLINLGDSYANQERFLRHYYNAFKSELPEVPRAPLATRANLIRVYEALIAADPQGFLGRIITASGYYGQITGVDEGGTDIDDGFRRLSRAQGAPSYVLLLWLLAKVDQLGLESRHIVAVADLLSRFFVRRNLTGDPPTYALPRMFIGLIDKINSETAAHAGSRPDDVVAIVRRELVSASVEDSTFRRALTGSIYDDNTDMARFILTTLAEDQMTKETHVDLWQRHKGRYVWTIEHILPQGGNLPQPWINMLGGDQRAAEVQGEYVHKLGNLTITGFNSSLSNKSFPEKTDRVDSNGRQIGYRNGLSLNADLLDRDTWTEIAIKERTDRLANQVVARFSLATG